MWEALGQSMRLSGRELEIVQLIFDDEKELTIGGRLGISSHTVNSHIQRMYHKLQVSSRTQLMARVFGQFLCLQEQSEAGQRERERERERGSVRVRSGAACQVRT